MTTSIDRAAYLAQPADDDGQARPDAKPDWGDQLISLVAIGLLTFSWTAILGALSVLIQLGLLALLVYLKPVTIARALRQCWPLLILAVLTCASTLWSDMPGASLRYGLQLAITLLIGIAVTSVTSVRGWVRAVFLATFIICVVCIAYGRKGVSAEGPVLIGILGSKNVMAMLAQIVLTSGLAVLIDRRQPPWARLCAPIAIPVSLFVLLTVQSAGGLITAALSVVLLFGFWALSLLRMRGRVVLAIAMLLMSAPVVVALPTIQAEAETFSETVLKKDPGLTGRDYLWAFADKLIAEQPVLGHGFRAIWMGQDSRTIGLLRWAGQKDGRGFHFHDSYREWAVDFGLVGAAVVIGVLALSGGRLILRGVAQPSAAFAFVVAMFIVTAIRAKVEAVFMPLAPTTLLLFCLAATAWIPPAARSPTR